MSELITEARKAVRAALTAQCNTRDVEDHDAWALERKLLELVEQSMTNRLNARNARAKSKAEQMELRHQ